MHHKKYKECSPEVTVKNIKKIPTRNEIDVEEVSQWNKENSVWPKSMSLKIKGLPFSVNGKGTDDSFALASAYGEFMERFQNISMMRSFFKLNVKSPSYVITPDRHCF